MPNGKPNILARVVGIDVSRTSIEHTRSLAERHRLDKLTVHQLPITEVSNLNTSFDQDHR
jgi:hypothetical protein